MKDGVPFSYFLVDGESHVEVRYLRPRKNGFGPSLQVKVDDHKLHEDLVDTLRRLCLFGVMHDTFTVNGFSEVRIFGERTAQDVVDALRMRGYMVKEMFPAIF